MFFHLKASSKDIRVLEKFASFLSKLETSTFVLKHSSKQNKRKIVTILKSPHVNKTAQEQFEYRFYHKQFLINSLIPLTFLFLLKKAQGATFSGLRLEIKSVLSPDEKPVTFQKVFNPENYSLNSSFENCQLTINVSLVKRYIQLFDCYGETFLKGLI